METTTATVKRDAVLVEDAHVRPMMGIEVLEPVPARNVPYELSDPFILVHEATVPINPDGPSSTPPTPIAASTTSGTSCRATRARATARGPAGRSSGPGWEPAAS